MKKEIFTRSEVRAILTEAIKQARRRTQKPNTHGNGRMWMRRPEATQAELQAVKA